MSRSTTARRGRVSGKVSRLTNRLDSVRRQIEDQLKANRGKANVEEALD
jgi:hypothetical protein